MLWEYLSMGVCDNLKPVYKITKPSSNIYHEGKGFKAHIMWESCHMKRFADVHTHKKIERHSFSRAIRLKHR